MAAAYLRAHGYTLVAANHRTRYGEIDLIVEDRRYVVFVEVKLRASGRFAQAREFVDSGKQQRVRNTALMWLSDHETEKQPRFDVVEIYAPDGIRTENPKVVHLKNAF